MATNAEARALQFMRNAVYSVRSRVKKMSYSATIKCHICGVREKRDIFLDVVYHYPDCDFIHMVEIVIEADTAPDTTPEIDALRAQLAEADEIIGIAIENNAGANYVAHCYCIGKCLPDCEHYKLYNYAKKYLSDAKDVI